MKRKIGIIIAGIAAMSCAVAFGLFPSGNAYAETWCSVNQDNSSTYGEAAYKRCAHIIRIDHADSKVTLSLQNTYNTYSDTTKKVSDWCGASDTYAVNCNKVINKVVSFTASQNSQTQVYAPSKEQFVTNVWSEIKQGTSHIDPCKGAMGTSGETSCLNGNSGKNWMYYQSSAPAGYVPSTGGGGGGGQGGSGGGSGSDPDPASVKEPDADTGSCTSILPWCNKDDTDGSSIKEMIKFVISVMTGAVVIAGTIGIIICGVMMMTARDNEAQVAKAKGRLIEIVIGIIAWGLIAVLINFFIPQSESTTNEVVGTETTINEEKDA